MSMKNNEANLKKNGVKTKKNIKLIYNYIQNLNFMKNNENYFFEKSYLVYQSFLSTPAFFYYIYKGDIFIYL